MPELFLSETERISFKLPESWTVLNDFTPRPIPVPNPVKLMNDRIGSPVGMKKLTELIKPEHDVVLLIDDYTRSTPHEAILNFLVDSLERIGVGRKKIHIVIAGGTHAHLDKEGLRKIYGVKIVEQYDLRQHDCKAKDLVEFTKLPDGTPVKINPLVENADFCIGIGVLEPHPFNGFGGGYKIIFPGVADYDSIIRHHGVNVLTGCGPGSIKEWNHFYHQTKAIGEKSKLNFIINFLVNEKKEPVEIVTGHPLKAYLKGVDLVKEFHGTEVKEEADITFTSSYPYDVVTQTFKPISTAYLGTKEGGEIIIAAKVLRGPELKILDHFKNLCTNYPDARCYLGDFQLGKLAIPGAPVDMNIAMAYVMSFNSKVKITYVTKDMNKEEVEKLGFHYASSIEEAVSRSYEKNRNAKVNVYSMGGLVLPLREKNIF